MNQRLIIVFFVTCLLFTGCTSETDLEQATEFYREYSDLLIEDVESALTNYVFYKNEADLQWALSASEIKTLSYEIINISELHDELWAINVWMSTSLEPDGFIFYNFVAKIDNRYYVITNPDNIPDDLKLDIDFSPYYYPDALSPNEVFDIIKQE